MVCAWCFAFFRPLGGLLVTLARYYPLDMDHSGGSLHGAVTCCRRRPGGARRERGVRACGRRATGHGARAGGAALAHIRVSLVSAQVGRVIGAPVSRRRQGRGAAHRRRLGRARVPSGVAAAGHVWGHRSALEVFALHLDLPPNAMAQPR